MKDRSLHGKRDERAADCDRIATGTNVYGMSAQSTQYRLLGPEGSQAVLSFRRGRTLLFLHDALLASI